MLKLIKIIQICVLFSGASQLFGMSGAELENFINMRKTQKTDRVYLIVDAASDNHLAFSAEQVMGAEMTAFFDSFADEPTRQVAAFIFELNPTQKGYKEYINKVAKGLHNNAVYLAISPSSVDFKDARKQFRKMFFVSDDANNEMWFRFFDPRILRPFVVSTNKNDLKAFFGPFHTMIVEDEIKNSMVSVQVGKDGAVLGSFKDFKKPGGVKVPTRSIASKVKEYSKLPPFNSKGNIMIHQYQMDALTKDFQRRNGK